MPHGGGEHVRPDFITERRWGKRFPITAVKPALPTQTPHTRPLTAAGHSEAWGVCCRRGWGGVGRMSGAGSAHTSTAAVQAVSTQRAGKPGMRSSQGTECCFHPPPPGLPCLGLCFELILGAWGRGPIAAFIFIFWKFLEHLRLCPNEIEWYWSPIIMQIQLFSNEEKKNSVSYSPFLVLYIIQCGFYFLI